MHYIRIPKKCCVCEHFKKEKGDPHGQFYRPMGVCDLPSTPKYKIVGDADHLPEWCPIKEMFDEKEKSTVSSGNTG